MWFQIAVDTVFVACLMYFLFHRLRRLIEQADFHRGVLEERARAYRLITECESAVWRATSREALESEICRLAVDVGGYRMAWLGQGLDDENKSVRVVARAGHDDGYLDSADIAWSDTPRGRGPTGSCIRTGTTQICRWTENDESVAPWRNEALRRGYRSSAALPLRAGNAFVGALTLYSDRADAFDSSEADLMLRMANAFSFALERFDAIEAEKKLLTELKTLAQAVEASPVTVVITDREGRIEYVNKKFSAVSGYGADEVLGRNPRILQSGNTTPEEYRRMWETITAGGDWRGVFLNRAKDGHTFWEYAHISPVRGEDGEIRRFVAVKEDITEKRSLEQQLRQAQKLESLGALAGGVAHDFNNLLTVIEGHCGLLELGAAPTAGAAESVAEIRLAARRGAEMTRRLLLFGRKQEANLKRVDLGALVTDYGRILRRMVGEAHSIKFTMPADPLFAEVDPGMIEQVLMNLVINARDAMPGGGAVAIAASRTRRSPDSAAGERVADGEFIRISVRDSGCGISKDIIGRIFDPFFTTKEVGKGTGLGLSVVDGIVRQHLGWVEVESEPGRGSEFSVFLPACSAPDEAAKTTGAETIKEGRGRILLVEDDASVRALAARVLRKAGYEVVEAETGPDGLAAHEMAPRPFDLLISDMVMPGGMTGADLGKKLRFAQPDLRVLLMSGYHPEMPAIIAKAEAGYSYLSKPFSPAAISDAVKRALGGD